MKVHHLVALGPLALGAASSLAAGLPRAKPEAVGLSGVRLARIDAAISRDLAEGSKAGAVVAVARHGKLAYLKAYGLARREGEVPMRTDSFFRLFSETKPMISVGLLMLYEEGRFALTDPLDMYIPEFAGLKVFDRLEGERMVTRPARRKPTVQDLFRHTVGFPGAVLEAYGGPVEKAMIALPPAKNLQDIVTQMAGLPLAYEPGTDWRYGPEHDIQAYLIEKLSGMPVEQFLRTRLFEPLAMKETFYTVPAAAAQRYTAMYEFNGKGSAKVTDPGLDGPYAGAARAFQKGSSGISSTAEDQLRFGQMLLNGGQLDGARILSRKTVELMLSDQLPREVRQVSFRPDMNSFPGYRYGLGIAVVGDVAESGMPGSVGAANWAGFANTDMFVDPKEDMLIIAWTQSRPGDFRWMNKVRSLAYQALVD